MDPKNGEIVAMGLQSIQAYDPNNYNQSGKEALKRNGHCGLPIYMNQALHFKPYPFASGSSLLRAKWKLDTRCITIKGAFAANGRYH